LVSLTGIEAKGLGSDIADHVRHSGTIPFVYIDYLAVQAEFQNEKLGTRLFLNALERCEAVAHHVAFYGVALHSLTTRTTQLYAKYGFKERGKSRYLEYPLMVLPVQTLILDMRRLREAMSAAAQAGARDG
jgi:GNAT superfamily N-acetyltransferase